MYHKPRLLRITTASISLKLLLRGQFTYFQQHGFDVLTVSAHGPEVTDIIAEGVPHHVVPMTRAITPLQDVICLWKLVRIIRKFNPDIVHTHTPKAGLLGMMAAWICRVPRRLHTVAGLPLMESTGLKRMILLTTEKITYSCATSVYANSMGLLRFIREELSIVNYELSIIGKGSTNGIDSMYFSRTQELMDTALDKRRQYLIPDEAIVFCFVGRIVKDKGIIELVDAFKKLSSSYKVYLMLVGPLEQALDPLPEEIIHYLKHNPQVIMPGFQQDVRPWLLASNMFVFPSYREGFPNVVMQAACMEVSCIVSDINGCNEIIQHNVSGLVVPNKNARALYDAMYTMMMNPQKRLEYSRNARTFVTTHFDQPYIWREWLNEYHKLLQSSTKNQV